MVHSVDENYYLVNPHPSLPEEYSKVHPPQPDEYFPKYRDAARICKMYLERIERNEEKFLNKVTKICKFLTREEILDVFHFATSFSHHF